MKRILPCFLITLLFLSACGIDEQLTYIQIEAPEGFIKSDVKEETEDEIVVALASVISPEETRSKYNILIKYLEDKLNRPIVLVQRQTYDEVNQLIKKGRVDVAFICSLSYVLGVKEGYMEGLVVPKVDGKVLYQSYIITRKDSDINYLEKLKGKRFAFTDPVSFSGRLSTLYTLDQLEYTAEEYFGEIYYTYSHDNSIQAVLGGVVDGASVDSALYDQLKKLHPDEMDNLQIIEKGPMVGTPPVVVSKSIDPKLKNEIRDILINLGTTQEGIGILDELSIDEYVVTDYNRYQPIENMLYLLGDYNETN